MPQLKANEVIKTMTLVLEDVAEERVRQMNKYGHQEESTYQDWLTRIVEELGEIAQAMQKGHEAAKPTDADNLYEEIIQTAALCTKFAEVVRGYFPK
jgi:NTP pyrophosphatase (non-canonical NTP hydrolase)